MSNCQTKPVDLALKDMIEKGIIEVQEKNPISTWNDFQDFANKKNNWKDWCFRGQCEWEWNPETSLKRTADALAIEDIVKRELGMIRRFKREYRQYSVISPADDDHIQWMSIMQHHSAPTRLLDITYSIYIGLYFAVADPAINRDSALWCFNIKCLDDAYKKIAPILYEEIKGFDKDRDFIKHYKKVLNDRKPKVYRLNPYEMEARLTRQNGGFLVPMDIRKSFFENLSAMTDYTGSKPWIIKQKLKFGAKSLHEVLLNLFRMNSTPATLFPGIDGVAASLKMLMTIPVATHTHSNRFR